MVLQSIRERLTGILAFFILGILVIPFAFVGVNSYFTAGSENIVARVNDVDVSYNDFNQSYSNFRRRMQAMMGPAFDPVEFDTLVARREHLDRLIDEELLRQAATAMGLDVDDERLGQEIRSMQVFQVEGVFNPDVYQSRLLAQGMTPKQFEAEMRAQSIMQQLPASILLSSLATPAELAEYAALQDQTRSFKAVLFRADEAAISEDIPQEDIEAWYRDYPDQYRSEERVRIEYLELSAVEVDTGNEPDEEFLRARYEQQKGRFISPEQRRASHILIQVTPEADDATREDARQRAMDLAERAKAGEDFAALAREYSEDLGSASQGGDLDWIEPGLMAQPFEDALYELTLEVPISEPVQTGFGWHVIRLEEIRPSSGMSYEEARQTLIEEHQEEEAEREYLEIADRLVDIIYEDPTTLESAALELGMEIQTTEAFSRAGGEGIAANPQVVEAAFSDLVLLQDSVSDPVDLGDNHMAVIKLLEHLPATIRPLDDVRDEIVAQLRQQRAADAARAAAEAFLEELEAQAEGGLAALAERHGLEVTEVEAARRGSAEPDPLLVTEIFRMPRPQEGQTTQDVLPAADAFAVVVLEQVADGQLEQGAVLARQQYRRRVANAAAAAESLGLLKQLREAAQVEVFEERLR